MTALRRTTVLFGVTAALSSDARLTLTVSAHGNSRTFVLRHGTRRELGEFEAPHTPWRINAGVAALLAR